MRHRNWLTVILRIFGVTLIAFNLESILQLAGWLVSGFTGAEPANIVGRRPFMMDEWTIAGLIRFLFGLYLIFGGNWLINICMRNIVGRCPGCGCDIVSVDSDTCPKCGTDIPPAARPVKTPAASDAAPPDDKAAIR